MRAFFKRTLLMDKGFFIKSYLIFYIKLNKGNGNSLMNNLLNLKLYCRSSNKDGFFKGHNGN